MISLVVICFNETEKLQKCLESVEDFADELIVVDLGSSDDSIEVARKSGAKVFHHKFVPFVELVRDYAISKVSGDWVLVLDPDEEIEENLKEKLKLPVDYGVLIASEEHAIVPKGPASLAGIKEKDILLEINGEKITTDKPIQDFLENFAVNETIKLKILRDGENLEVKMTLTER